MSKIVNSPSDAAALRIFFLIPNGLLQWLENKQLRAWKEEIIVGWNSFFVLAYWYKMEKTCYFLNSGK